jgi:hypothetical protein
VSSAAAARGSSALIAHANLNATLKLALTMLRLDSTL